MEQTLVHVPGLGDTEGLGATRAAMGCARGIRKQHAAVPWRARPGGPILGSGGEGQPWDLRTSGVEKVFTLLGQNDL